MVATAVLLAACGSGGPASGQRQAAQASAAKLDVASVRPGMSTAEVTAMLNRAGWKASPFPGRDWANEVAEEKGRQTGRMVIDSSRNGVETVTGRKGDEEIIVSMKAVPAGAVATLVRYSAPMAGRTGEQIRTQMVQRYGPPTLQSRPGAELIAMTWCTGGEYCKSYYGVAKPALMVEEDVYHKLHVNMTEGIDAEKARQKQLLAAASGGAAPKSSF